MSATPVIAVTQRVVEDPSTGERRDALAQDWTRWMGEAMPEAALAPVPNALDAAGLHAWLDAVEPAAIILSGGGTRGDAPERDATEDVLLAHALQQGLPLLGVCRGLQVVNLHFGGGVRRQAAQGHVGTTHEIALQDGTLGAAGSGCRVNSFHDDLIAPEDVAPELRIVATAPDGSVEALAHATRPILGVLWHPERSGPSGSFDRAWMRAFLLARGGPIPCAQ